MPKTSLKQFADETQPRYQQYQKFGMKGNVYLPPCLLVFMLAYAYNEMSLMMQSADRISARMSAKEIIGREMKDCQNLKY